MLPSAQRVPAWRAQDQALGASEGVSCVGGRGVLASLTAANSTNADSVTSRALAAALSFALVAFVVLMLMSADARSLAGFGGRPPGCLGLVMRSRLEWLGCRHWLFWTALPSLQIPHWGEKTPPASNRRA